jgi:hypothetical protein
MDEQLMKVRFQSLGHAVELAVKMADRSLVTGDSVVAMAKAFEAFMLRPAEDD